MGTRRLAIAAACWTAAATLNAAIASPEPEADAADDSARRVEQVVVTAHPLSAEGLALASEVLEGEELAAKLESSIGETVAREPGVHAAGYGQAASRPVIHGLSGPRVRLMEDRIDALDVSVTSADHAVTIEPFVADRIEVLKGPSTLLYGSGAIGGVVDVHTGRIPHESPDALSGRAELRYGDNGDRRTAAGRVDGGRGAFAWHLDGFHRDADPYRIAGAIESDILRAREAESDAAPAHRNPQTLPGSQLDAEGAAAGASLVGARGFAGLAVSWLDAAYGLPGGHDHEEEEDADPATTPSVDLEQHRVDVEAGLAEPFAGFDSLNLRIGINDYRHREREPDGAVSTTFDNEAVEARLELTHLPLQGFAGAAGLQLTHRDFSAVGEEAFIVPVTTTSAGVFWVAERSFARFDLEAGARLERVKVNPSHAATADFDAYALSVGLILPFGEAWSLGLVADHTARAPVAEELFSDGPHLATRAFEVGDPGLTEEKAMSLSANLRYGGERWYFNGTLYAMDFTDFIYETPSGELEDGLPVFVYTQGDARFLGIDAEARVTALEWPDGRLELSARYDRVSGRLTAGGDEDLPRIPPTRYGLGIRGHFQRLRASIEHLWVKEQERVAPFELPTDGYRDLRAFVGIDLATGATGAVTVFAQGRNLGNEDQRQHTSFIKDFAPLPARTVEAGIRVRF